MFLRRYQWVMGVLWLVVAGTMLLRDSLLPDAILERIKPGNGPLIVFMTMVFAMWNFARWYAYSNRRVDAFQSPLRKETSAKIPETHRDSR